MVDDDQAHDGRNADIDEVAQRKVELRFKVFRDQRDEFKIQEPDDQSVNHVVAILLRMHGQQDFDECPCFPDEKCRQNESQDEKHERKQTFHVFRYRL